MSTSFHPQTDGATERANRSIGQILRTVVANNQRDWAEHCPMVEFAINSSVSESMGYAPFEIIYGYMPRINLPTEFNTKYKGVKQFAEQAKWNIMATHDAIIASRVRQMTSANKKRRTGDEYAPGDLVYLSTKNLNLPKGRARKLVPKFIGPYKVLDAQNESSNVTLELPEELKSRKIHSTFHTSLIRPYIPNNDEWFPNREAKAFYDFGSNNEQEWFVDEIIGHEWTNEELQFRVQWTLRDVTWEPLSGVKELEALDRYLELQGVKRCRDLPKMARSTLVPSQMRKH